MNFLVSAKYAVFHLTNKFLNRSDSMFSVSFPELARLSSLSANSKLGLYRTMGASGFRDADQEGCDHMNTGKQHENMCISYEK